MLVSLQAVSKTFLIFKNLFCRIKIFSKRRICKIQLLS
eukprot:UN15951